MGGNLYSVPEGTRSRAVEVRTLEIRIFEAGRLIAVHALLEGRGQRSEAVEPPSLWVEDLMQSKAYRDPKHQDHESVSARVREFYESQPGGDEMVL